MTTPKPEDVETVLRHVHPEVVWLDPLFAGIKGWAAVKRLPDPTDELMAANPASRKLHDTRQKLLAMSGVEVARLAAQARAVQAARDRARGEALEAGRFYNQHTAFADFTFWAKVENWTADEAVALLLGRDPRVVSPKTLAAELKTGTRIPNLGKAVGRAAFHREFDDLLTLVRRSDALSAPLLKPHTVLAWARSMAAVAVPPALAAAIESTTPATLLPLGEPIASELGATKRWTPERLAALAAARAANGTKAAAEQFNISEARVRKLLPTDAKAKTNVQGLQSWPPRAKLPTPRT